MSGKREYGDYQTPDSFALSVCEYLKEKGESIQLLLLSRLVVLEALLKTV